MDQEPQMSIRRNAFAILAMLSMLASGCARYSSVVEQMQSNEDAAIAAQGAANE